MANFTSSVPPGSGIVLPSLLQLSSLKFKLIDQQTSSVACDRCRRLGMWEQKSSIRIWAGTRLHPDLGATRLGKDLPGPARILMLDCLFHYLTGTLAPEIALALMRCFPWLCSSVCSAGR